MYKFEFLAPHPHQLTTLYLRLRILEAHLFSENFHAKSNTLKNLKPKKYINTVNWEIYLKLKVPSFGIFLNLSILLLWHFAPPTKKDEFWEIFYRGMEGSFPIEKLIFENVPYILSRKFLSRSDLMNKFVLPTFA